MQKHGRSPALFNAVLMLSFAADFPSLAVRATPLRHPPHAEKPNHSQTGQRHVEILDVDRS
jgi:hypothetical protein